MNGSETMLNISEWLQHCVVYVNGSVIKLYEYVNGSTTMLDISEWL